MSNQDYTIEAYSDQDREALLFVWEKSVRATHDFLQPYDFSAIKALVSTRTKIITPFHSASFAPSQR